MKHSVVPIIKQKIHITEWRILRGLPKQLSVVCIVPQPTLSAQHFPSTLHIHSKRPNFLNILMKKQKKKKLILQLPNGVY